MGTNLTAHPSRKPRSKKKKGQLPGVEDGRRAIMRIELTREAMSAIKGDAGLRGMTQIAYTSRVMTWFAEKAPDYVKEIILGRGIAGMDEDMIGLILQHHQALIAGKSNGHH